MQSHFSIFFPYSFLCLFTILITVDRMFAITLAQRYTDLITKKIFKVIAIILFLISVTSSSIFTTPKNILPLGFTIVSNLLQLLWYSLSSCCHTDTFIYILHFAARRKDLKQLRKQHIKNSNEKRLANTIIWIYISQLICFIPYLFHRFLQLRGHIPYKLYEDVRPWISMLVYFQCFCNALIITHNKKTRKISKNRQKGNFN